MFVDALMVAIAVGMLCLTFALVLDWGERQARKNAPRRGRPF
jgi:hypothetical protein